MPLVISSHKCIHPYSSELFLHILKAAISDKMTIVQCNKLPYSSGFTNSNRNPFDIILLAQGIAQVTSSRHITSGPVPANDVNMCLTVSKWVVLFKVSGDIYVLNIKDVLKCFAESGPLVTCLLLVA